MKCTTCQDEIDLLSAVAHSIRSWPALETILHLCPKCSTRLYLRFERDTAFLLCAESILSPAWKYISSEPCPALKVRSEAKGLRIHIGRASFLIRSR